MASSAVRTGRLTLEISQIGVGVVDHIDKKNVCRSQGHTPDVGDICTFAENKAADAIDSMLRQAAQAESDELTDSFVTAPSAWSSVRLTLLLAEFLLLLDKWIPSSTR